MLRPSAAKHWPCSLGGRWVDREGSMGDQFPWPISFHGPYFNGLFFSSLSFLKAHCLLSSERYFGMMNNFSYCGIRDPIYMQFWDALKYHQGLGLVLLDKVS